VSIYSSDDPVDVQASLAYYGSVNNDPANNGQSFWDNFIFGSNFYVPNDTPLANDFLHSSAGCPNCGTLWSTSAIVGNVAGAATVAVTGAGTAWMASEEAPAITQFFFGRAGSGPSQINSGIFNSNNYFRAGSGWSGSASAGQNVFRISIGSGGNTIHLLDIPWAGGLPPVWPISILP
jgi:hypothetical protein